MLFGEQITPVISPRLAEQAPIRRVADLAGFTLIDVSDAHRFFYDWQRWFSALGEPAVQPRRWLGFNLSLQMMQAARAGQGVALARVPLVDLSLASGELAEALPGHRVSSPRGYWMLVSPRSAARPEVQAFTGWLREQARQTAAVLAAGQVAGELPSA
jgi:DNA-binding transcriptional LysR family regulator